MKSKNIVVVVVALIVVGGAAFYGGMVYGKSSAASQRSANFAGRAGQAGRFAGMRSGAGANGGFITSKNHRL